MQRTKYLDLDSLDGVSLSDLPQWARDQRSGVPEDCWENARLEYDSGYHEESPTLKILWEAPETDAERQEREQRDARYREINERQERAMFERLKAKYGA